VKRSILRLIPFCRFVGCSDEADEEEEEEETEEEQNNSRQYFLREHKPRTKMYEAPIGKFDTRCSTFIIVLCI